MVNEVFKQLQSFQSVHVTCNTESIVTDAGHLPQRIVITKEVHVRVAGHTPLQTHAVNVKPFDEDEGNLALMTPDE